MLKTIFVVIGAISTLGWVIVLIAEIVGQKKSYEYCLDLYSDLHTRVVKLEEKGK